VVKIPSVLWSLRTTPNRSTKFTLFFMSSGAEAVLPTELQYGFPRVWAYQPHADKEAWKDVIDLLKECCTPILKEVNRSFHVCAQDVQITHMANSKVNSSQCYDYNISEYISYKMTLGSEKDYRASSITTLF
jgi:hypothetical protein